MLRWDSEIVDKTETHLPCRAAQKVDTNS